MAANYLHGVETIEIETGPRPVKAVKSAVIGLIGTAPCGPVNQPTLCLLKATRSLAQSKFQHHPAGAEGDLPRQTVVVINAESGGGTQSTIPSETVKVDDNGLIQSRHRGRATMSIAAARTPETLISKAPITTIDMLTGKITFRMGNQPETRRSAWRKLYLRRSHQSDRRR